MRDAGAIGADIGGDPHAFGRVGRSGNGHQVIREDANGDGDVIACGLHRDHLLRGGGEGKKRENREQAHGAFNLMTNNLVYSELEVKRKMRNGENGAIVWLTVTLRCHARWLGLLMAGAVIAGLAMGQATPSATATIEGSTLGGDGLPLAETSLTLARKTPEHEGDRVIDFSTKSDAFGRFAFPGLAAGRYVISAAHDGYEDYQGAPLDLSPGQRTAALKIEMLPLAVLSGKVTDEDGNPMPDITVSPMQRDLVLNGRVLMGAHCGTGVKTGADGVYRLMLEPGRWYLSFKPPSVAAHTTDQPEQGYVTTYYPGVPDPASALGLEAVAGQQMPELNVRLRKTDVFHVRGKVVGNLSAYSVKIAAIREPAESESDCFEGQTVEADGAFDIVGLPSGPWELFAAGSGSGFMELGPTGRASFDVVNRNVEDIVVAVHLPAELHGSVRMVPERTNADSPPVPEIRLVNPASSSGYSYIGMEVQRDGTFSAEKAEPKKYRLDLTPPQGGFVQSVLLDGREHVDSLIDLTGESRRSLQITISMTAGTITGSVTNPDGAMPTAAIVTLVPDGPPAALYRPELHPIVRTDATGHFIVRNVTPGTYRVYAWERLAAVPELPFGEPMAFADPEFPRAFDNMSAVVTVGESESKQVSLHLISAARMEEDLRRK